MAPLILATDKTQLTQFSGGQAAYPVYLTLGNLPKAIRRKPSMHACILLGYLSVDTFSKEGLTKSEIRDRKQRLFHASMRLILEPLLEAGKNGVELTGGDGCVRLVFPVLFAYVADYPEQCLVTCSKYGTCPRCRCPASNLADPDPHEARRQEWTSKVLSDARQQRTKSDFYRYCSLHEVSGGANVPFWAGLPFTDIHDCITPDVLHQLFQGVFKHVVNWCEQIVGAQELDRRVRALPPAYGVRHFKNGISALSQVTGKERKDMARILLGCLVGILPRKGMLACRALLDFIYLAQYSTHDSLTLGYMEESLRTFQQNKAYFVQVDAHPDLNIPKFHSLLHYVSSIRSLGTTDNYNTEMFERLHIDFAKEGWRASNHRDPFPQMITWLSRREKVQSFENYLYSLDASLRPKSNAPLPLALTKHPSQPRKPISLIQHQHDALAFPQRLKEYLNHLLPRPTSAYEAAKHPLPFDKLDVFHSFKFHPTSIDEEESSLPEDQERDTVKACPSIGNKPSRFDTVVVVYRDDAQSTGLQGKA